MASVKSSEDRRRENQQAADIHDKQIKKSKKRFDPALSQLDLPTSMEKARQRPAPAVPNEIGAAEETTLRNRDGKELKDAVNEIYKEFTDKVVRQGVGVVDRYNPWAKYNGPDAQVRQSSVLAADVYTASKATMENGHWVIKEEVCALGFCRQQTHEYQPPRGYVLKLARAGANGFGAVVYENVKTGERTVAYAGTKDKDDFATDADLVAKTIPPGGTTIAERILRGPGNVILQPDGKWESQVKQSMKNPALTGGVSLQFKLRLTRLLLALVPHVLSNRGLVDANRGSEKSSCPDPAAIPIYFAQHVREFLFQLPTGYALQGLHYLGDRILWRNHHVQMNMVPFHSYLLQEPIGVKFPHCPEDLLQIFRHPGHEVVKGSMHANSSNGGE
jgi:hypothetical protein